MIMVKENFRELLDRGEDLILRGRYESAQKVYDQALEINPDHYLVRNAIGKLMFINKEYIAAADNFYLAAFDAASRLNLGLLSSDSSTKLALIMKKNEEVKKATQILQDYSKKSGIALFAHQYDEPTETNPRQAKINRVRIEMDPCGYCGCTDLDPNLEVRLEREITTIGKRFMVMMNGKMKEESQKTSPLEIVMEALHF